MICGQEVYFELDMENYLSSLRDFLYFKWFPASQMAKAFRSMSIRYKSNMKVLDWYRIDVNLRCFAIWVLHKPVTRIHGVLFQHHFTILFVAPSEHSLRWPSKFKESHCWTNKHGELVLPSDTWVITNTHPNQVSVVRSKNPTPIRAPYNPFRVCNWCPQPAPYIIVGGVASI